MDRSRKPLAKMQETTEPSTMRLTPSAIARVKAEALATGIGHTTGSREYGRRGRRMARLEDLEALAELRP